MKLTQLKKVSVALFVGSCLSAFAVDFDSQIKPILETSCIKCHNSDKDKGDLNLETLKLSQKGGDGGAAITPGDLKKSLLIERIKLPADHDDIMPPKGDPLTKEQITLLEKWITEGAKWPEASILKAPKTDKKKEPKTEVKIEATLRPAGHRLLMADKGIIAIVDYDGKIEWKYKAKSVHDLKQLSNGNILFQTNKTTVVEVNPKTNEKVFEYNSAIMNGNKGKRVEVHSFHRLKNGNTAIAESGATRMIEVDNSGKLINQFKLQVKKPHPHRDTRLVTITNEGNYLVCHEGDGVVKEYTPKGEIVWTYQVPLFDKKPARGHSPSSWGNQAFCALRLPNGNTLIATGNGHSVIEVTKDKEVVWHLKQYDLPGITLAWVTTLQLLPNGNIVIGNCHAGTENPQVIEINKKKEVIWTFKDFKNFGNNLSNTQVLDALDDLSFFKNKVHPVLEDNCLKCHGHDEKHLKGGLWLESRVNAMKGGDISTDIVNWKNLPESPLLRHINYFDNDHQMPPKKKMAQADIDILTEWVERGMPYDPYTEKVIIVKNEVNDDTRNFWSYRPLTKPQVPAVKNSDWSKNDLDKFILAKLESNNLTPNPKADKIALIRRAYYDLIGLPPTPQEISEFVNDKSPKAFEKTIDKLLASKHYGEKWGRHWLDVVRFAETNSFERDGHKPEAWQYRQWVIDSFNTDKPYDQMVLEQLAGDELPNANKETITGTGYYRLGIWDDEPADRLQSLYDEYNDIVSTTGEAYMGMTVGCARCHNHKIDPYPMANYYGMLAFFHNVKPYSRSGHENTILTNVISDEKRAQIEAQNKKKDELRAPLLAEKQKLESIILSSSADKLISSDLTNVTFKFYRETWDKLPDFDMFKAETVGKVPGNWFDISLATRNVSFGFVFEGDLFVDTDGRYDFVLDSDDGSELFIDNKSVLKFDGIHSMGSPKKTKVNLLKGTHKVRLHYFQKEHGLGLSLKWGTNRGLKPLSKPTKNTINIAKIIKNTSKAKKLMGDKNFARYKQIQAELRKLKNVNPAEYVLSVKEHGTQAKDTFILRRGSAHSIGPKVEPHFPTILTNEKPKVTPTKNTSGRRLAFAKWLVEENPLTARVMANRIWQYHFGRGIVKSPNNFGMMGDAPTHPQLLNYLAATFKENNWSIKKMHKLIMTSAAYQMSSKQNPVAYEKDPANNLFWRFDMRRLTGEEIRDSILQVMGKLDKTYGGPSVFPKVSSEVLAGQSKVKWTLNTPESHQYRRSIYTFQMRSLIYPLIESFDAATPDATCDVRFITTQPTQALTMMNSDLLNKSAELMSHNVRENAGSQLDKQMAYLWEQVTGHKVKQSDIDIAKNFISKMKANGASEEKSLQQLCLIMLNLNEFIYLD